VDRTGVEPSAFPGAETAIVGGASRGTATEVGIPCDVARGVGTGWDPTTVGATFV
jgi:hypothetical protein